MNINDKRICQLLGQQDPRGFNLLLEDYYRPLVLWADTYLKDIPAAEDLVQEFIVNFWEKRIYTRIEPEKLRGYLFTAIKNNALKHLAKIDPLRNPDLLDKSLVFEVMDIEDITEEMLQEIEREIERLPPRMREILRSVYVDGLRYKDVASKFNISIATVKTLLVRALKRLREIFAARKQFF